MPSLSGYQESKQRLVRLIQQSAAHIGPLSSRTADGLEQLAEQLDTSRFQILVVGEFKRGKSSLLNALIGAPIFPVQVKPCTNALTRLEYASAPTLNGQLVKNLAIELKNMVTVQADDPQPVQAGYPVGWLAWGVTVTDAPGPGEDYGRTSRTQEAMLSADAVLLVLSAEQPPNQQEQGWIEARKERTFLVFNRIDLLDAAERAEIQAMAPPGSFFVSARTGENIEALRDALVDFLATQRGPALLQSAQSRALTQISAHLSWLAARRRRQDIRVAEAEAALTARSTLQSQARVKVEKAFSLLHDKNLWDGFARGLKVPPADRVALGLTPAKARKKALEALQQQIQAHLEVWKNTVLLPVLSEVLGGLELDFLDVVAVLDAARGVTIQLAPEENEDPRHPGWPLSLTLGLVAAGVGTPVVGVIVGVGQTFLVSMSEQRDLEAGFADLIEQLSKSDILSSFFLQQQAGLIAQILVQVDVNAWALELAQARAEREMGDHSEPLIGLKIELEQYFQELTNG